MSTLQVPGIAVVWKWMSRPRATGGSLSDPVAAGQRSYKTADFYTEHRRFDNLRPSPARRLTLSALWEFP